MYFYYFLLNRNSDSQENKYTHSTAPNSIFIFLTEAVFILFYFFILEEKHPLVNGKRQWFKRGIVKQKSLKIWKSWEIIIYSADRLQ